MLHAGSPRRGQATSLEQDQHAREPAQEAAASPVHLLVGYPQPQLRKSLEQRGEGDLLPLNTCQWRPEADVDALAKGDVPVDIGSADIEDIQVHKPPVSFVYPASKFMSSRERVS